jgi:hypothetical protein
MAGIPKSNTHRDAGPLAGERASRIAPYVPRVAIHGGTFTTNPS